MTRYQTELNGKLENGCMFSMSLDDLLIDCYLTITDTSTGRVIDMLYIIKATAVTLFIGRKSGKDQEDSGKSLTEN